MLAQVLPRVWDGEIHHPILGFADHLGIQQSSVPRAFIRTANTVVIRHAIAKSQVKGYNCIVCSWYPSTHRTEVAMMQARKRAAAFFALLSLMMVSFIVAPFSASAEETVTDSFYTITTDPWGDPMIVGDPGTTILIDPNSGEVVDVLPPGESTYRSVTASRGCTDSNAGCWAGGTALGDIQYAGTGIITGFWPYRNAYTTGNKAGKITFAINGIQYTPVAAGPWTKIATIDGQGVDGIAVERW